MTTASPASVSTSLAPPSRGFLALSPELVLEIVSHIGSGRQLRSARNDTRSHALSMDMLAKDTGKPSLASLRLVCRYLSEVLEHDAFKSITFDFSGTRVSEAHIEAQLSSLSNGASAACRHATLLTIKSLRSSRRPHTMDDDKVDSQANSILRILTAHLEKAILSFQSLRSVAFNIEQVDDQTMLTLSALSALPSLEDVTLRIGAMVDSPATLAINRFSRLRSLQVSLINHPRYYGSSGDSTDEFVDHISEVISQSPLLHHLSVLQPIRHKYDVSFRQLTRKVSPKHPLLHLKSLYLAIPDLKVDPTTIIHLKSLTTIHVEGSAHTLFTGEELWPLLAAAGIHLRDITVCHLSGPLTEYLLSYSGLQRLHVLIIYYPHGDWTAYDRQLFMRKILPLHNLSPTISAAPSASDPPFDKIQGLVFEVQPLESKKTSQVLDILPTFDVTVCIDSIPDCLSLVLDSVTQSEQCRVTRLNVRFSSTMMYFGCGTGKMAYTSRQIEAGNKWLDELEITDPQRYPSQISIGGRHLQASSLMPSEDAPNMYTYQSNEE